MVEESLNLIKIKDPPLMAIVIATATLITAIVMQTVEHPRKVKGAVAAVILMTLWLELPRRLRRKLSGKRKGRNHLVVL